MMTAQKKKQNKTTSDNSGLSTSSTGGDGRVYFRKSVIEFGRTNVGTCGSVRVQLCNSTKEEVVVNIIDPTTPFIVLHKKIKVKSKSFVRLPIRFVPVGKGVFQSLLHCDIADGRNEIVCLLRGVGE